MPGRKSKKKKRSAVRKRSTKASLVASVTVSNADGSPVVLSDLRKPKEWVNHPDHYGGGDNPYEVIKVLEAWERDHGLGWTLLTAIKHVARYKNKGRPIQDLKKARWYIDWVITRLEEEEKQKTA